MVYLHDYATIAEAIGGLDRYFRFYNEERLHQALGYHSPATVYAMPVEPSTDVES